jgi:hypothetical protein
MLLRVFFYGVALLSLWAALQGFFLTYQAHQFLNQPYNLVSGLVFALASALVLASGILAALRRKNFYAPAFVVAVVAPIFVAVGLSQMGDMTVTQAFAQATCAKNVGVCFPQAASFLQALAATAIVGGALVIYLARRSR